MQLLTDVRYMHIRMLVFRLQRVRKMQTIAFDVVIVRQSVMWLHCANAAQQIEVLFGVPGILIFPTDSVRPLPNYFGHLLVFYK